jgi:predicted nucleotidyltransferase
MMSTAPKIEDIRHVLERHYDPKDCCVFLFGSRATGTARYNSDWDIGVVSRKPIPGRIMEKAREDLETIRTLHTFDLVDLAKTSTAFREIALRRVIPIIGDLPHD